MTPESVVQSYVGALVGADAAALVGLLDDRDVSFISPFSTWTSTRAVSAACTARTRAFADLTATGVLHHGDSASIRWQARVDGRTVEGVDLLTLADGRVRRIDTFLRPADVLDSVYAAMTVAWPR